VDLPSFAVMLSLSEFFLKQAHEKFADAMGDWRWQFLPNRNWRGLMEQIPLWQLTPAMRR
jgi:hypothetical protein